MTSAEIVSLMGELAKGRIKARVAVAQLTAGGMSPPAARDRVFIVLGGGDVIDGDRYYHSGKLVSEVKRRMEE